MLTRSMWVGYFCLDYIYPAVSHSTTSSVDILRTDKNRPYFLIRSAHFYKTAPEWTLSVVNWINKYVYRQFVAGINSKQFGKVGKSRLWIKGTIAAWLFNFVWPANSFLRYKITFGPVFQFILFYIHNIPMSIHFILHTYIILLPFHIGVGRDHFLTLARILTNSFCFFYFRVIPYTCSPVSGTLDLAFLQNLLSLIKKRLPRSSPNRITI
jgi:hypothetical protein